MSVQTLWSSERQEKGVLTKRSQTGDGVFAEQIEARGQSQEQQNAGTLDAAHKHLPVADDAINIVAPPQQWTSPPGRRWRQLHG